MTSESLVTCPPRFQRKGWKKERGIVLISGGLDSAVALFWALNKGLQIYPLTFNYFHRSQREIEACKKLAGYIDCKTHLIDLGFLKEIDDLKNQVKNELLSSAQSAYIPCRNIIFYGIAASFAEILDAKYIVGGHNRNDATNFPDSSRRFFEAFNNTASIGRISGNRSGKVLLPFSGLDKSQVIKLGHRLKVPFELTWSCYRSARDPCGVCHSCLLREQAFRKAGLRDPIAR